MRRQRSGFSCDPRHAGRRRKKAVHITSGKKEEEFFLGCPFEPSSLQCSHRFDLPREARMRHFRHGGFGIILSACLLISLILAQTGSGQQRPDAATAADETALRALAPEFYAAYAKKDLDGFIGLWSAKAPDLASRRQAIRKLFAENEKIEVKSLVIPKITIDGGKAKLRVDVEMNAIETKTGKPSAGLGKIIRALHGVKEEGAWKVWREAPAVEDLADALATTETNAGRQRFFENKLAPYQGMVELLVAQNQSGAALAYAERSSTRCRKPNGRSTS
jgi:hypothetical protein